MLRSWCRMLRNAGHGFSNTKERQQSAVSGGARQSSSHDLPGPRPPLPPRPSATSHKAGISTHPTSPRNSQDLWIGVLRGLLVTSRCVGVLRPVRPSPSSGTLRYRVARLTPRTSATSVSGVFSPIIFRACFNFAGLNALGRPPSRPRSRAAAKPARVRSLTSSSSKLASAPKTWNTNRPPGVVVSMSPAPI